MYAQQSSGGPVIEHARSGSPFQGKVLAAIQPHSDDIALLCAGTVCKLMQRGLHRLHDPGHQR